MTKTRFLSRDNVQFAYAFANDYQKLEFCEPKVFLRPRDIVCIHQITGEGLSLTCASERIFPRGKCFFLLTFNSVKSSINANSTSESLETLADTPTYFKSSCTLFVPKSTLVPALYHFNFSMHPRIYHNNTDMLYGTNDSLAIILDHPQLILENCPGYIEENEEAQCTCLNRDTSPIKVFLNWFTKDGQTVLGNVQSNVLKVKAKSIAQDFYCEATNALGWKSDRSSYKLKQIFPVSINNLTVNGEDRLTYTLQQKKILSIHCEVEGDPIPHMQIFNGPILLSEKKGAITPFSLTYSHNLTCESYGVFSCLAVQGNRHPYKTFTVLLECVIQFNFSLDESKEHLINAQLNSEVSIVLGIFGHPCPNNYIILRGSSKFIFTNVTNGNAIDHGYTITYKQTNMPYGILNLTFKVFDRKNFTNYNFIIQNRISPPVVYNFLITDGSQLEIHKVHKRFSTIIAVCITSIITAIIIIAVCVWRCRSNRATVPEEQDHQQSFASHFYEATPGVNVDLKTNSDHVIYSNAGVFEETNEGWKISYNYNRKQVDYQRMIVKETQ